MYFAVSALLAAGLLGLAADEHVFPEQDVAINPASLRDDNDDDDDEGVNGGVSGGGRGRGGGGGGGASRAERMRAELGITHRMPRSLREAMEALKRDTTLNEALPVSLVRDYLVMKESERRMMGEMSELERRSFLIERY